MKACAALWRIWRRINPDTAATKNALLGRRNWRRVRRGWTPRSESSCEALRTPWILDIDTTLKRLYGHQVGAEVGYNPTKPGRPSHTLHTCWIGNLRLVLALGELHRLDAALVVGSGSFRLLRRPRLPAGSADDRSARKARWRS